MREQDTMPNVGQWGMTDILPSGQARIPKDVAIKNHVAQFWNPQNHGETEQRNSREYAIKHLIKKLHVPESKIESMSWEQMNLIYELHKTGNHKAMRSIIKKPTLMETEPEVRDLLMRTAAWRMYVGQYERDWITVDYDELAGICRDIAKTNADWPCEKDTWQKQWQEDLKSLDCTKLKKQRDKSESKEEVRYCIPF